MVVSNTCTSPPVETSTPAAGVGATGEGWTGGSVGLAVAVWVGAGDGVGEGRGGSGEGVAVTGGVSPANGVTIISVGGRAPAVFWLQPLIKMAAKSKMLPAATMLRK